MNKMIFCFFFFAFLAFGQRAEKIDRQAATRAWDLAMSLPSDTPQISGGAPVVENEINGVGRRVWLVATKPGTYLLKGVCGDEETKLGTLGIGEMFTTAYSLPVLDTAALQMAAPFFGQFCSVDVIRINGGVIEKSSTVVNAWVGEPSSLRVGSEGITPEGQYYLAIGAISQESVAVLGRSSVATEIRNSLAGTTVLVFPFEGLPPAGPTTLTVCTKGVCSSVIFERKLTPAGSSEKG